MVRHFVVSRSSELNELCDELRRATRVAFDTEFVPEYTYAPELCLIQVATDDLLAVIDPQTVDAVAPFWEAVVRPDCELVVHAGKEEMTFCLAALGRVPEQVVDVQLAAGLVGLGHPLSHLNLVQRLLNVRLGSEQTRTDWRKRPLSKRQIEYAMDDVRYLLPMRDRLRDMLAGKDREDWLREEMTGFLAGIRVRKAGDRWWRVGGTGGFNARQLAVLREIGVWRDRRAQQMNKPLKWVMRDDQIAELAKRQPKSVEELQCSRGLGGIASASWAPDLLDAIGRGVELPEDECPKRSSRRETPQEQMIQKILSAAMIDLAQENKVAASLLGSNSDLLDLMAWQSAGEKPADAPKLARGWRAQVCGACLTDLLDGKKIVRIHHEEGDVRLIFEPYRAAGSDDSALSES